MEMFGNEFAKKRYLKYQGAVSWDQHSIYKALYRMQDGGIIVVGKSLDCVKKAWTRYKEAKE